MLRLLLPQLMSLLLASRLTDVTPVVTTINVTPGGTTIN